MKNLLMPQYRYRRITDIELEDLKSIGIKGLILDVDNTIAYDCEERFIEGVPEWLDKMRADGIKMIIVSNALMSRAKAISKMTNVRAFGMSAKPLPFGYIRAVKAMGLKMSEVAVVGDQLITDIRGGNICNMVTIFVDPARKEERNVKIFESRRKKEKPVLEEFDRIHNGKRGIQ